MIIFNICQCSSSLFLIFSNLLILCESPLLSSLLYLHSSTSLLFSFTFMSPCSTPSTSLQSVLMLCIQSPLPFCFPWSIRHNRPLVSGLAWLWRSATCFSSSFLLLPGFFVPSASNRLFRVWDRLFLTLPSLGATGLSLSERPDFLAWRVWVYSALVIFLCMCTCIASLFFVVVVFSYPWSSVISLRQSHNTQ